MKKTKLQRLREIRGIMLGLEMNLSLLEQDLDVVDRNLVYLSQVQADLIYNINLHKSKSVISVIKEYKRSIDELRIVKSEIIKYKNHRKDIGQKLEKKMQTYNYYLDEYEKTFDETEEEPTVLQFKKVSNEQK